MNKQYDREAKSPLVWKRNTSYRVKGEMLRSEHGQYKRKGSTNWIIQQRVRVPSPVQLIAYRTEWVSEWVSHVKIYQLGDRPKQLMWDARNKHVTIPEWGWISDKLFVDMGHKGNGKESKRLGW